MNLINDIESDDDRETLSHNLVEKYRMCLFSRNKVVAVSIRYYVIIAPAFFHYSHMLLSA